MPGVAAVVLSYNRRDYLRQCIQSIYDQSQPVDSVIVVDNHSADGTLEMIAGEFPRVVVLAQEQNLGAGHGFRLGMQAAVEQGCEWAWLLDDDVRAQPDAVRELLAAADELAGSRPKDVILQCLRVWLDGRSASLPARRYDLRNPLAMPDGIRIMPQRWYDDIESLPKYLEVEDCAYEGLLIPRRIMEEIGYLVDEMFFLCDDTEYGLRAQARGFRIVLVPSSRVVRMITPPAHGQLATWKVRYWVRNLIWLRRMYGENWLCRNVTPWLWAARYTLPAVLKGLWWRDWERFRGICTGAWQGIWGTLPRVEWPAR